jgi:hypothetical protein
LLKNIRDNILITLITWIRRKPGGFSIRLIGGLGSRYEDNLKEGQQPKPRDHPHSNKAGIMSTQPVQPLKRRACGTHFIAEWKDWFERTVEDPRCYGALTHLRS